MKENKYRLEKVLHELIRDLPALRVLNNIFEKGYLTTDEAFIQLAEIIQEEARKEKKA